MASVSALKSFLSHSRQEVSLDKSIVSSSSFFLADSLTDPLIFRVDDFVGGGGVSFRFRAPRRGLTESELERRDGILSEDSTNSTS